MLNEFAAGALEAVHDGDRCHLTHFIPRIGGEITPGHLAFSRTGHSRDWIATARHLSTEAGFEEIPQFVRPCAPLLSISQ